MQIRSDGLCDVTGALGAARLGPHALGILGLLSSPRPLQHVVAALSGDLAGRREAIGLLSALSELQRIGAICPQEDSGTLEADAQHEGFGAVPIHAAMLGDEVRTLAWLNAVRAQVRPGDVVVDVGTGTGILAVAAVQAGARHVYALEASSCIGAARALIDANGVADRVTLIRGWSTALELPERADVLVSEILDDDPFGEGILEVTADSWQRHLKPDARQLPRALTLYGQLVEMDEETLRTHTWTPLGLEQWSVQYGLKLSALSTVSGRGFMTGVRRSRAKRFRALSDAICLTRVVLAEGVAETLQTSSELVVRQGGTCHGLVTYFVAELTPEISVTTAPLAENGASHWLNPTFFLAQSRQVVTDQRIGVSYRYPSVPSLEVQF